MHVVVVDLLCNSPLYCGPVVKALCDIGAEAELASPEFYLEPGFVPRDQRSQWIADVTIHASHPRTVRLLTRSFELSCNFRRLLRAIRVGDYDVVHVQWIPLQERQTIFMSLLRSACDQAGALLAFTAHNVKPHDYPTANRFMIRKNVDMADLVIAHTQSVADGLREDIGVSSEIAIIPHGPLFTDRSLLPPEEAAARLDMVGGPVVLFQGAILPYKGIDILMEAWPFVLQAHPAAVLALVGRSGANVVRSQLAELAKMTGVRIVDRYVSTELMLDYYAASDVVVFPYKAISQSGALMTAVGLGKPTVVTPLPGFMEQVAGLESVVVARDTSGPAVAEALCAVLRNREALAEEAMRDKRRIMESPGGWPSVARRTLEEYERAGAQLHNV